VNELLRFDGPIGKLLTTVTGLNHVVFSINISYLVSIELEDDNVVRSILDPNLIVVVVVTVFGNSKVVVVVVVLGLCRAQSGL